MHPKSEIEIKREVLKLAKKNIALSKIAKKLGISIRRVDRIIALSSRRRDPLSKNNFAKVEHDWRERNNKPIMFGPQMDMFNGEA